jgi:CubicO group peptidase (beta-lactamase class C family)
MNRFPCLLICFFLFLQFASIKGQQIHSPIIDTIQFRSIIEDLAKKYHVPDYALAIVYQDSLWFHMNKNKENVSKNYLLGSSSKSITALTIMKLVEEGKIRLDYPIKHYLPWFEMRNKNYTDSVTVRHLLNQKSGFERRYGFYDPKTRDVAVYERKLAAYIKKINVRHSPGKTFLYCNLNYVLLGLIIENVTHQSYAEYLKNYVVPEIGMENTYFTGKDNHEHNLIQPYHKLIWDLSFKSKDYYYSDFMLPAGYISSNINDLCNFLRFMLNKTIAFSGDTMLSASNYGNLIGEGQTGYAMGWYHFKYNSIDVVDHSGLTENFNSSLSFFPDVNLGCVILCNVNSLEFCAQADKNLRLMLAGKPVPVFRHAAKTVRWMAFLIPVALLLGLIYNFARWKKYGFRLGFVPKVMPNLRLLLGISFSIILFLAISLSLEMYITTIVRSQPDIGWGLILTTVLGVTSSLVRYFVTAKKMRE